MHNFWLPLHPDVIRPIGGVKQVHRLAEQLIQLGHKAFIVQEDKNFRPNWFTSDVPTCSIDKGRFYNRLDPAFNTVILPETFTPFLSWYAPRLPKIIFNQNFSYTFGVFPGKDNFPDDVSNVLDFYKHSSIKSIWLVSSHNLAAFRDCINVPSGVSLSRIVNSIETDLFSFGTRKKRQIAYMPRKNPRDCKIIKAILSRSPWFADWHFVPIDGMNQQQVASVLMESVGFLATGHPEGFGLPLAEAAACGNALFGYTGLGGQEIFDLARKYSLGHPSQLGDWSSVINSIKEFVTMTNFNSSSFGDRIHSLSSDVSSSYSQTRMRDSLKIALDSYFQSSP